MEAYGKLLCRNNDIYISPDANNVVELGTREFPYKTLDHANIEVFNFWLDKNRPVVVKLEENTLNRIYFEDRPIFIFERPSFTIFTYTNRIDENGDYA